MAPYLGAPLEFMERCVTVAKKIGIENVHWSGTVDIEGENQRFDGIDLAQSYTEMGGCIQKHSRNCKTCVNIDKCRIKKHVPSRST